MGIAAILAERLFTGNADAEAIGFPKWRAHWPSTPRAAHAGSDHKPRFGPPLHSRRAAACLLTAGACLRPLRTRQRLARWLAHPGGRTRCAALPSGARPREHHGQTLDRPSRPALAGRAASPWPARSTCSRATRRTPRASTRADAPRAVLLGVAGDFEAELEFAYRQAPRLAGMRRGCCWRARSTRPRSTRLFDALPATMVPIARDAATLRAPRARRARPASRSAALTERQSPRRDRARFAALVRRSRAARAARRDRSRARHAAARRARRAGNRPRSARALPPRGDGSMTRRRRSRSRVRERRGPARAARRIALPRPARFRATGAATICLEDVDRLAPAAPARAARLDRERPAGGPRARPRGALDRDRGRAAGRGLDPELAQALAGFARARAAAARATGGARRDRRCDAPRLHARGDRSPCARHPWPDNQRELEAVAAPHARREARRSDRPRGSPLRAPRSSRSRSDGDEVFVARSEPVAHAAPPVEAPASEPIDTGGTPVSQQATPLQRLSAAVAHEVGNPLVGIRTYAALLPSRFDDAEFRGALRRARGGRHAPHRVRHRDAGAARRLPAAGARARRRLVADRRTARARAAAHPRATPRGARRARAHATECARRCGPAPLRIRESDRAGARLGARARRPLRRDAASRPRAPRAPPRCA